mmetsp:Transcript_82098/g.232455  ORF Transcript_82098/g.232455 Transcript_82098/m.232455 type:complete len:169 (-) Transcript_82098:626-1132(-)
MAARKTVVVRGYGKEATVGWFEGASDESIKTSITSALLMKADSIVARDLDGNVVAVSQAMPSGLTLVVDPSDSVPTTTTARASAEQRTLNFRGQVRAKTRATSWRPGCASAVALFTAAHGPSRTTPHHTAVRCTTPRHITTKQPPHSPCLLSPPSGPQVRARAGTPRQ